MDRKGFLKLVGVASVMPILSKLPAPAFAQGAKIEPNPAFSWPVVDHGVSPLLSNERVIEVGFKTAIQGYEHVYPLLAEAVENMIPANTTRIEWARRGSDGTIKSFWNNTQIIRSPLTLTNSYRASKLYGADSLIKLRQEQLHQHLSDVENTLRYGKRGKIARSHWYTGTAGGINQFPKGKLILRPLRDLVLLTDRQEPDMDVYSEEWLSEFSLQVG